MIFLIAPLFSRFLVFRYSAVAIALNHLYAATFEFQYIMLKIKAENIK